MKIETSNKIGTKLMGLITTENILIDEKPILYPDEIKKHKEEYNQNRKELLEFKNKEWVVLDDEVKEALSLYQHLKNHTEVQNATKFKGMPVCKICGKSAYQIMCEEWKLIKGRCLK